MSLPEIQTDTVTIRLQITYDTRKFDPPSMWEWNELLSLNGVHTVRPLPPPTQTNFEIISAALTTRELHELLYPPSLDTPVSPHPSDILTYRVRVVSYELGLRLAAQDPGREYFHFEFFPSLTPPRVEIWNALAWKESLTRALRLGKHRRETDPTLKVQDRYNAAVQELTRYLSVLSRVPLSKAHDAAEGMLRSPATDDLFPIFRVPENLINEIKSIRQALADLAASGSAPLPLPSSSPSLSPT